MNNINIIGRMTANPEIKTTNSNKIVTSFTIAVDDGWGDNKKAFFFNCVAWEKKAETIERYCQKGSQIAITGKLAQRSYTDKEGNKRSVVEIVVNDITFCGGKSENTQTQSADVSFSDNSNDFEEITVGDDDLPF